MHRQSLLAIAVLVLVTSVTVMSLLDSGGSSTLKLADAGTVALLLLACAALLARCSAATREVERLVHEREVLLGTRRDESRTDVLTGLGNRRALADDLLHALAEPSEHAELLLAVLDLDGFKQYNDTFGHGAGDALLQRLGLRLAESVIAHAGFVYRIGGDEFCMFARVGVAEAEALLANVTSALKDGGDGWQIGCSLGAAWIPSEAQTEADALQLADERMYANKAGRSSPSQQVTDALLAVLAEQNLILDDHVERVAQLSGALARELGQSDVEVRRIHLAARLHDIGKTAIPVEILNKPGPLDDREWAFIRQHPLIGERIVLAAPALAHTAPLIRASHERYDGEGYPDGLRGEEIPLGARIIAVCDAYDVMTSDRLYQRSLGAVRALEQLVANAGSHFDAKVVEAFCAAPTLHVPAAAALEAVA
jgi:diguanylate cyclase (GGDEF)-like protein